MLVFIISKMSKIRETVVANCEKKFLLTALSEFVRLDGRSFQEFRDLSIDFGRDWGCCYVSLGKTRVLAQTSCEIQEPKSSRPSEGILNINLELNPIAAPNFEAGRQSEQAVQLNRILEKLIKDSKAIDLESLCIKTNEKVWSVRVDINVLNHEGNILDCASVAALASLAHFRRADVTSDGEDFRIHPERERDPIPTVIHHYPTCNTFAIFKSGEIVVADPTLLEEGVADAFLTIGLNGFKELCVLHLGGKAEITQDVILKTITTGVSRTNVIIESIKKAVKEDSESRELRDDFKKISIETPVLTQLEECLDVWKPKKSKRRRGKPKKDIGEIETLGKGSTIFTPIEEVEDSIINETSSDDDVIPIEPPQKVIISISDSEEEDVVML